MKTLQEKATIALSHFESFAQLGTNGYDVTLRIKDTAPEWVTKMVRIAHTDECVDFYCDDVRFNFIVEVLDSLSKSEVIEHSDSLSVLTEWLNSDVSRCGYLTMALNNAIVLKNIEAFDILAEAQRLEKLSIKNTLVRYFSDLNI